MYSEPIRRASRILADGGIVAYPTEGVFGLGCMPGSLEGVARILAIKRRKPEAGLILIAASPEQLVPWVAENVPVERLRSSPEHPVTWVVGPSDDVPYWVTGANAGVAVRLTTHPVAALLCNSAGSALISTSANIAGRRPARTTYVLRREFHGLVDAVVPGGCGPAAGPSEIRVLDSGRILRAGKR